MIEREKKKLVNCDKNPTGTLKTLHSLHEQNEAEFVIEKSHDFRPNDIKVRSLVDILKTRQNPASNLPILTENEQKKMILEL